MSAMQTLGAMEGLTNALARAAGNASAIRAEHSRDADARRAFRILTAEVRRLRTLLTGRDREIAVLRQQVADLNRESRHLVDTIASQARQLAAH